MCLIAAKIQQIKKNNKDKKNKKEGAEQIARLEEELTQRHEKELEELKNSTEQVLLFIRTLLFINSGGDLIIIFL